MYVYIISLQFLSKLNNIFHFKDFKSFTISIWLTIGKRHNKILSHLFDKKSNSLKASFMFISIYISTFYTSISLSIYVSLYLSIYSNLYVMYSVYLSIYLSNLKPWGQTQLFSPIQVPPFLQEREHKSKKIHGLNKNKCTTYISDLSFGLLNSINTYLRLKIIDVSI